jgi:pyruvate dehydrogenase E2 component (dihydrolipoamide acetyltransferase)
MAHEIRVPRLGWSMEEGTFVRWLKADGQEVRAGEPLFELEGEKALQEIEAVDSGTLRIDPAGPTEGAVVAVGAVLGHLVAPGEEVECREAKARGQESGISSHAPPVGWDQPAAGAGPPRTSRDRAASSPRARRVAAELGVDWRQLAGSGRGGRVRERDVRQATAAEIEIPAPGGSRSIALSSRRRIIAERMAASSRQTAPVTLTTRADATSLASLRRQFQTAGGIVPSYTDIIVKLAVGVLREHPLLAARWNGEQLVLPADDGFHIGIAVDSDEGLLVPVIRDVARRSLVEVAQDSKRLLDQARAGRLAAADMQGSVFTITNLGAVFPSAGFASGIDAFTPIINLPEVAILGLGAIRPEAVVLDDGQIAARPVLTLSLTFDHRALDGAPAARFLQSLAAEIADATARPY